MILPAAAGRGSVAASFRRRTLHTCCAILPLAALSGCTDYAFYVKPDSAGGVPLDLIGLNAADFATEPLDLAVTFKSDGVVQNQASDALYRSIKGKLKTRGIEHLHRSRPPQGDVSDEIAALAGTPAATTPRLLVLVENHPDLSGNTTAKYFFSGMSMGAWSLNKPTDRYDITLAFRDAHGQAHFYRSHQELIFSTGSTLFGRDREAVAGLRRFDDPDAAFGAAMSNSLTGGPGVVKVGQPDFAPPQAAAATPAKALPQAAAATPGKSPPTLPPAAMDAFDR